MSKQFKGKICVYCAGAPSSSVDHVIAREFFHAPEGMNVPKVPACNRCNNAKSKLEHYLASLLPFGGRHPDAAVTLHTKVPRRLHKNASLHRVLAEGQGRTWIPEHGLLVPTMTLPVDIQRVKALFELITKGLILYHWQTLLTRHHFVQVETPTALGEKFFNERLWTLNARHRVADDLGNGTFAYEGAQGVDCPQITIWRMRMYGGVQFGGDPEAPAAVSSRIDVLTGPKAMHRNVELVTKFGWNQPDVRLVRHSSLASSQRQRER